MNLVFDKYFPIGEAASRYLISFLEKTEDNEEILLLQLAKFSMKVQIHKKKKKFTCANILFKPGDAVKQLLVEGCLNYCPVIKNWKLYISILLRDDVELDIKEPLVELFAEAVHQVLIGRSAKPRDKSRRGKSS